MSPSSSFQPGDFDALRKIVRRNRSGLLALQTRADALEATDATTATALADLQTAIEALGTSIEALDTRITALETPPEP